jgi:hypothetical protein
MDIEFNVDLADIEAFNIYMYNHSPIAKKMWRRNKIIALVCVTFSLMLLVWSGLTRHLSPFPSIVLVVLTIGIVIYAYSLKNIALKRELKRIREAYSKNGSSLGKQKCTILPQSINYSNGSGDFTVKWDFFSEVINSGNYIYVVTSTNNSDFIIPRNAFTDDSSFNQLYTTIQKYHQDAIAKKKTS